jgi:hypothetical protein
MKLLQVLTDSDAEELSLLWHMCGLNIPQAERDLCPCRESETQRHVITSRVLDYAEAVHRLSFNHTVLCLKCIISVLKENYQPSLTCVASLDQPSG